MKKILFLAFALVASTLVFTSCDNNKKKDEPSDPTKQLVGTWSRDTEGDASGYYETQTLIIDANNAFAFNGQQHYPDNPDVIAIMLLEGTYEVSGDIITVHFKKHGWNHNGEIEYIPEWEGYDEKMKFSVVGKELTLIRNYGEEYQGEPEIYTKQ